MIKIQREDFDIGQLIDQVRTNNSGCIITFIGTVRDHSEDIEVAKINLEVYQKLAQSELEKICEEAFEKYGLNSVNVIHRYGDLIVGDNIVFIGVSAGHREGGFDGCHYIIDELKKRVPIWKKEFTPEGEHWIEV